MIRLSFFSILFAIGFIVNTNLHGVEQYERQTFFEHLEEKKFKEAQDMLNKLDDNEKIDLIEKTTISSLPLFCYCAMKGNFEAIKLLVENGVDINQKSNIFDRPALLWAGVKPHYEIIKYLMEKQGATYNLDYRFCHNDENVQDDTECIIEKQADPCNINCRDNEGYALLHLVSESEDDDEAVKIITYLANKGANLNIKLGNLCCKIAKGCFEYDPKMNQYMYGNATPLHFAAKHGNVKVVQYLLEQQIQKIDVNAQDKYGNTPLHEAAMKGYMGACNCHPYEEHKCPQNIEIVSLLLKNKANPNIANKNNQTPYDQAVAYKADDIAKLLHTFMSESTQS